MSKKKIKLAYGAVIIIAILIACMIVIRLIQVRKNEQKENERIELEIKSRDAVRKRKAGKRERNIIKKTVHTG